MSEPLPPAGKPEATRATAHLPGLEIEIVHRVSPDRDAEQISINLQAVPSFEAFGRWLEAVNPFAFWMQATRMLWFPWLKSAHAALPPGAGRELSRLGGDAAPHGGRDARS